MLQQNRDGKHHNCLRMYCSFLLFLLVGFGRSLAQQPASYIFKKIAQQDGLLHTAVRVITQDEKGYIWILTENGLQRYDGYRFVNYPYDLNSPDGIIDTRTASLFSDQKNNCLWIIDKKVQKFDLRTNKFQSYTIEELAKDRSFHFDVYKDAANNDWLLGDFGLICPHPFRDMSTAYLSATGLSPHTSTIFYTDTVSQQTWMVNFWQGLLLFDKKTKRVYTHSYNPLHNRMLEVVDKTSLVGILHDSKGNVWLNTNVPEFYRYQSNTQKLSTYSLANFHFLKRRTNPGRSLYVQSIFEDGQGQVWLGTASAGLLKYQEQADEFLSVADEEKDQKGLYYNYNIQSVFQDRDENIWLGTDKGISIFNPYRQKFKIIRHEEANPSSLPKEEIQCFIQAGNGDILVGTWGGGLTLYDSNWNFKKNLRFSGPFEYDLIWSFVQNDDGTVWAGCQHGYVHIYDPLTQKVQTIHPPELENFTVHCMTKDREGNIWFGLHNGKIAEWNKKERKFYSYRDGATKVEPYHNGVLNIFFDSKGRCWASTEGGLKQFDTKARTYAAVYNPRLSNPAANSATSIQGIEEYNDSTLVMGTQHGGITLFNISSRTFSRLSTPEGIPSNTIYSVKKDAKGDFWLTTDYSVFKFLPAEKKFVRYPIDQGTINSSFETLNFYTLQNGDWLAATATEIISFRPAQMDEHPAGGHRVAITGITVFDHPLFADSLLSLARPIHLDHQQNFLTVEFSLLSFFNQEQIDYFYKLSGINSDWVKSSSKQFASYTDLAPGSYTFYVKAENGGKMVAATSFEFIITPPFWKTWWFALLVVAVSAWLVFLLVTRKIRAIRRQAELKHKLAETEMMALRSQMNPHFIFNCLNAIDNLVQTNQPDKATTYLARFARLIRYLLESSKNNLVPFEKDFETLRLYLELEQFRAGNKFSYQLTADKELLEGDYKVPPLIIQPFVENAIQHGLLNKQTGARDLVVQASLRDNCILYRIVDNGVGRIKALEIKNRNRPEHRSYGIDISSERIQLHNQNDADSVTFNDIRNDNETGTEVQVKIKI